MFVPSSETELKRDGLPLIQDVQATILKQKGTFNRQGAKAAKEGSGR